MAKPPYKPFDPIIHGIRDLHVRASVVHKNIEEFTQQVITESRELMERNKKYLDEALVLVRKAEDHCKQCEERLQQAINTENLTNNRRKTDKP